MLVAVVALPIALHAEPRRLSPPRVSYLLSCGGCHGFEGVSNSKLVPDLKGQVGYFLNLPQGRSYLVRLPNVAFSTTTDADLTDLLNYVVFALGGASVPAGAKPYTMQEVAQLRRQPLTEVSLAELRRQMVQTLIDRYQATTDLRRYGEDSYDNTPIP